MKRIIAVTFVIIPVLISLCAEAYAGSAGSIGAFTSSGWAGAEYIAEGSAAEATVSDIYALYWNPAGLAALAGHNTKSPDDIRKRADSGDVSGITEEDLLRFSETRDSFFFQLGASCTQLDMDREAAFGGCAFKFFGGVLGAGALSVYSGGIDSYSDSSTGDPVRTGSASCCSTVGYLGYGRSFGLASFGMTFKPVYEKIADAAYAGGACDIGVQAEVLPFIKIGCVFQDIGLGEYPVEGDNLEQKWRPGSSTLRFSAAIDSRSSDLTFMAGLSYRMTQERFIVNAGARYGAGDTFIFAIGLSGEKFRAGVGCKILNCELWYAFSVDSVNAGYDNTVSLAMMW
jgi:hypothetical protein